MNSLEDFSYHISTLGTPDLVANTQDESWLLDLDEAELIVLIHELVSRLPEETSGDWYIEPEEVEDTHEYE